MSLLSTRATAQEVQFLTQRFGEFPIHLTEQSGIPLQYQCQHNSVMWHISNLVHAWTPYKNLTLSFDGENISVEETPSEGIFGGARSTGNQEHNKARTADYRNENTIIRNPRLPDSAPLLAVTGGAASTSNTDVDSKRQMSGAVPGLSVVIRNPA
jgi:hypothetical protein